MVDLALARELGLLIDETAPGEAAGQGAGRATFYPSELPNLQIGEHFVGSIEAVAADLASLGAKLGRPLHAILGQSFIVGRVVQFDYEHHRLKLDPTTVEEGISLPIEGAADLTPVVPVTVNGREVPVVLDTGSSLTLGIYFDAVDDLGLATARDAATPRTLTGARGRSKRTREWSLRLRSETYDWSVCRRFSSRGRQATRRELWGIWGTASSNTRSSRSTTGAGA